MTKTTRVTQTVLLAACAALLPAQETGAPQRALTAPVISIDFGGGSLRDLIEAMRRIDPRLNITSSAMAREVKLPDLSVKGAAVLNVLNAAAMIAPADYAVSCREAPPAGEPVYIVTVLKPQRPGIGMQPPRDERETAVYSLRSLVEAQPGDKQDKPIALSVDTVLSALEAGVRLVGGEPAELKYHRESGLLLAKGAADQLTVVRDVLQNLQRDQTEVRNALARLRMEAAQKGAVDQARQNEGKVDKK